MGARGASTITWPNLVTQRPGVRCRPGGGIRRVSEVDGEEPPMATLDYLPWVRPADFDDRPCVRDEQRDLTYAEFAAWVDAAAEQFAEFGVGPGSVVAVMLPN